MDDVSSNINITCDMLVQIIRNLILLSNTSTNVGPEALKSLLASNDAAKSPDSLKSDLEQYKFHLYHPMYLNNQLSQYNTKNLPIQTSSSLQQASSAAATSSRAQTHIYDPNELPPHHQHHHHTTK